jgi:hypothetical protein
MKLRCVWLKARPSKRSYPEVYGFREENISQGLKPTSSPVLNVRTEVRIYLRSNDRGKDGSNDKDRSRRKTSH